MMNDCKQTVQLHFRVTPQEKALIDRKMERMGTKKLGVYLRKMALDGYVVKLELTDLKQLLSLMRYAGNNLNQVAKIANTTGQVYNNELIRLQEEFAHVQESLNQILMKLSELH